jgi:hypothetical protein
MAMAYMFQRGWHDPIRDNPAVRELIMMRVFAHLDSVQHDKLGTPKSFDKAKLGLQDSISSPPKQPNFGPGLNMGSLRNEDTWEWLENMPKQNRNKK